MNQKKRWCSYLLLLLVITVTLYVLKRDKVLIGVFVVSIIFIYLSYQNQLTLVSKEVIKKEYGDVILEKYHSRLDEVDEEMSQLQYEKKRLEVDIVGLKDDRASLINSIGTYQQNFDDQVLQYKVQQEQLEHLISRIKVQKQFQKRLKKGLLATNHYPDYLRYLSEKHLETMATLTLDNRLLVMKEVLKGNNCLETITSLSCPHIVTRHENRRVGILFILEENQKQIYDARDRLKESITKYQLDDFYVIDFVGVGWEKEIIQDEKLWYRREEVLLPMFDSYFDTLLMSTGIESKSYTQKAKDLL